MSEVYQRYQSLRNATHLMRTEADGWNTLMEAVLSEVVLSTIRKYQQKLNVGVQDSVSDLLDTFKQRVTEAIFEIADQWRSISRTEVILYPRGCRFCYNRGHSTIIVIEQDPQVRSFLMQDGILGAQRNDRGAVSSSRSNVALAIPYCVFLLHFRQGQFSNLYHGWRNRTLESLEDTICRPVLPNIHDNLNVCLGRVGIPAGNVAQQTTEVLGAFWRSEFNNDLATYWWDKGTIDSRLRSAEEWARLSREDPMFVLTVNFRQYRTLSQMLDMISGSEETVDESVFRHRLSDNIDQHVETLFSKMMKYFKKTKFEKHFPKEIKQEFLKSINQVAEDLVDTIYVLDSEITKLSQDVSKQDNQVQPASRFWEPYSS